MDHEMLERLLIDRSLGSLSTETEALLTDYLEYNAVAAALARDFDDTVALAKRFLPEERSKSIPPLPRRKLEQSKKWNQYSLAFRKIAVIAACLLIGFLIGLPFSRSSRQSASKMEQVFPLEFAAIVDDSDEFPDHDGFWSLSRYQQKKVNIQRGRRRPLVWESLLKTPKIGGDS